MVEMCCCSGVWYYSYSTTCICVCGVDWWVYMTYVWFCSYLLYCVFMYVVYCDAALASGEWGTALNWRVQWSFAYIVYSRHHISGCVIQSWMNGLSSCFRIWTKSLSVPCALTFFLQPRTPFLNKWWRRHCDREWRHGNKLPDIITIIDAAVSPPPNIRSPRRLVHSGSTFDTFFYWCWICHLS